jgi:DNA-binding winged helix-turn-helix (wHTH) protein
VGFTTRFADFVLDGGRHQLLEGGSEVHLSPKAYEFLRLLVQERPRAISKTELHERLWPGTFVTDATLASVVAEVRRALGEGGADGRFIRTVHGYGYAFAADAADVAELPPPPTAPSGWLDDGHGRFELRPGENVIGRGHDVAVHVDSASISRHHARIVITRDLATVEDLGSKNGTWLRGVRVTAPVHLEDGDRLRVGTVTMTFHSVSVSESTITVRQ